MNRVSSMIATIQCEGCVSPVCEKKVVSVLITAVGKEQIDFDLARKVRTVMIARPKNDKHVHVWPHQNVSFEFSVSKLSEKHKIVEIGSIILKLRLLKDI